LPEITGVRHYLILPNSNGPWSWSILVDFRHNKTSNEFFVDGHVDKRRSVDAMNTADADYDI